MPFNKNGTNPYFVVSRALEVVPERPQDFHELQRDTRRELARFDSLSVQEKRAFLEEKSLNFLSQEQVCRILLREFKDPHGIDKFKTLNMLMEKEEDWREHLAGYKDVIEDSWHGFGSFDERVRLYRLSLKPFNTEVNFKRWERLLVISNEEGGFTFDD
jgi:hypothetical protein